MPQPRLGVWRAMGGAWLTGVWLTRRVQGESGREGRRAAAGEGCELCSGPIHDTHTHVHTYTHESSLVICPPLCPSDLQMVRLRFGVSVCVWHRPVWLCP